MCHLCFVKIFVANFCLPRWKKMPACSLRSFWTTPPLWRMVIKKGLFTNKTRFNTQKTNDVINSCPLISFFRRDYIF